VKLQYLIGFIILSIQLNLQGTPELKNIPEKGLLDLRSVEFNENSIFSLNGEWEFYWEQLLVPESYPRARYEGMGIYVEVPSYWENYHINGEKLGGFGYGTYAMTILLPEGEKAPLCISIPLFDVAYTFYVNDILAGVNGTVGTSREEEKPWYKPESFCYRPGSDTLQILIQVSNFNHRRGGFWQSVVIGGAERMQLRTEHRKMYNFSTMGVLLFFTLFFLIFWLFSRKDRMMLLFALTSIGLLIRAVNTGYHMSNSFLYTPWDWQIRMEYFGTYVAFVSGMLFLHNMFPLKYMKSVIRGNNILFLVLTIGIFVLPPRIFTYEMLIFQPLALLFLLHYLIVSIIGTFKGRLLDAVFLFALSLMIFALVSDIMLANSAGGTNTSYNSQLAFQVLILVMAVIVVMQWVKNNRAREHLETSLRFKNKVLSVVAHDLKSPVASVAQFADLLATKPQLSTKPEILQSLQQSSQAAVSLLDNLLFWGRSQSDELSVSPVSFWLNEVIDEVESLYTYMAIQKEVRLIKDTEPGLQAVADRSLVNIIVRNLVSNAIKFTPAGGEVKVRSWQSGNQISVSVKDNGVGISPEVLEMFEKKGQLRSTRGTNQEIGTGLGLQLVRDLVEKNHGILEVESIPGKGSEFTFTLPAGKQTKEK